MSSSHTNNGAHHKNDGGSNKKTAIESKIAMAAVQSAIDAADIYHSTGTTYLHIDNPLKKMHNKIDESAANPTGAVVPSISLATTFKQSTPGLSTARDDPNSFGMGYEYSRTGKFLECSVGMILYSLIFCIVI